MAVLAKTIGTLGAALVVSFAVALETFFLASWLFDRDCPPGSAESCAFSGVAAMFFSGITGTEALVGALAGGAFLAAGKRTAANAAFGSLVVVLAAEHAWLLLG
jgi:hypothetical protein